MKIKNCLRKMKFENIPIGDAFEADGCLYLKIAKHGDAMNVFNLTTNTLNYMWGTDLVVHLPNAELVING